MSDAKLHLFLARHPQTFDIIVFIRITLAFFRLHHGRVAALRQNAERAELLVHQLLCLGEIHHRFLQFTARTNDFGGQIIGQSKRSGIGEPFIRFLVRVSHLIHERLELARIILRRNRIPFHELTESAGDVVVKPQPRRVFWGFDFTKHPRHRLIGTLRRRVHVMLFAPARPLRQRALQLRDGKQHLHLRPGVFMNRSHHF